MLRQHQVRRYQERALDTSRRDPFRAIDWQMQGMTQTGAKTYGTADEWTLVIQRVQAIPAFLQRAQEQLAGRDQVGQCSRRADVRRDGIETTEANAKYFAETLPKLAGERISGPDARSGAGELDGEQGRVGAYGPSGLRGRHLLRGASTRRR